MLAFASVYSSCLVELGTGCCKMRLMLHELCHVLTIVWSAAFVPELDKLLSVTREYYRVVLRMWSVPVTFCFQVHSGWLLTTARMPSYVSFSIYCTSTVLLAVLWIHPPFLFVISKLENLSHTWCCFVHTAFYFFLFYKQTDCRMNESYDESALLLMWQVVFCV